MIIKNQSWRKPALLAGILTGSIAFSCQQEPESPITGDLIEFV